MGGCFSSGSYEEAACRRPQRVRPSDEDGKWPYVGERDVDDKAGVYIANFHRYQSEVVPMTPAPMTPPAPRAAA